MFDPHRTGGGAYDTRMQHNVAFSMLATYSTAPEAACQNIVIPELAKSWRWVDDRTFEVKLIEGVRFLNKPPVNGREVTADDVIYSLKRAAEFPTAWQSSMQLIKAYEQVDKYTVRFRHDAPNPSIITEVLPQHYGAVIMPKEAAGPGDRFDDPRQSYVGSGAFMFQDYKPGVKVTYEKNPTYFKTGKPYLDRLEYLITPDISTRTALLRVGRLTMWGYELPKIMAEQIMATMPQIQVGKCPTLAGGTANVRMYMHTDKPPFNDVRVRRAISMAVDRHTIAKTTYGGEAVVSLFPPRKPFFIPFEALSPNTRKYLEYHPQEAKALLAEAGYPNGIEMEIMVTTQYGPPFTEIAEGITAMMAQAGIKAKLDWREYNNYRVTINAATFPQAALGPSTSSEYLELSRFRSDNSVSVNRSWVKDPTLDSLIDRFMTSVDEKVQVEAATALQQRIVDQAYFLTFPWAYDYVAIQRNVRGFVPGGPPQRAHWFEGLWLEK